MVRSRQGILIIILALALSSCKWRDDFRERVQPQYGELPAEPTLNEDSDQFVGDKTARELRGEHQPLGDDVPEIDDRKEIPELPDYPSSSYD